MTWKSNMYIEEEGLGLRLKNSMKNIVDDNYKDRICRNKINNNKRKLDKSNIETKANIKY